MQGGARVTIDPRFHDGVLFGLAGVSADTTAVLALARRARDLGLKPGFCATPECGRQLPTDIGDLFLSPVTDGPDELLEAARRLGVRPDRCVVIETTSAGITAARDGGFGLIVGIASCGQGTEQRAADADVVITDMAEIDLRNGDHRMSALPDALESSAQIASVLAGRSPSIFIDFDGTLSEIVDDPSTATLVAGAANALRQLSSRCPVAVISGRELSDVRARVGVPGLWYAGSHGTELVSPAGRLQSCWPAARATPSVQAVIHDLRPALRAFPGVLIEDKRLSVAVHYRNAVAECVPQVMAAVQAAGQRHQLRVTHGRKVVELRQMISWGKGKAMNWIAGQFGASEPLLPIYIGDDLTDEDGFDGVKFDGIGIVVRHDEDGDRFSAAHFALGSPREVTDFLTRLATQPSPGARDDLDGWSISFDGYVPGSERLREALCTVGNGALASRAAAPDAGPGPNHYTGTYAAGVYNRLTDVVGGVVVCNESIVNLPNWLPLSFRIDGGAWFDLDSANLLSYRQTMNIRDAECVREIRCEDTEGRRTTLTQRRIVSMHNPHVCGLQMVLLAENCSGTVDIRSTTDAGITNCGVHRYAALSGQHLSDIAVRKLADGSVLVDAQTTNSQIPVAVATRTTVWLGDHPAETTSLFSHELPIAGYDITCQVETGRALTVEKAAAIFTGRDRAISVPAEAAGNLLPDLGRYEQLRAAHTGAWAQLWEKFDFDMPCSTKSEAILRLHILHLLQSVSGHTADLDAGVPARGLHGEAYRGHIFWDELFIVPLLTLRLPQVSRALLGYRSRRLAQARHAAIAAGYAGAMYPWQSGSDGREESQQLHLNPLSGRWNADSSHLAHHIGSAVAYNVWHYYQITGDRQYLIDHGAEVLVEIARFWVSRCRHDANRHRYVIDGVIGPDEFHSGYPEQPNNGVNNNAYTNIMAVWVILRAFDALAALPLPDRLDLLDRLGVAGAELAQWEAVTKHMFVPFHEGVITQFEGYEKLRELDWTGYRLQYKNVGRLDRILEAEHDDVNRYKAAKQADVLMLFYLLSADELREIFARLGYSFRPQQIPDTIDYYASRTSHGSTLSAVVHSWVSARGNRDQAMRYFQQVLDSDVADIQGGSTAEGIHLAAMAGSIDLLQRCFTGLETRRDRLVLGPMWPEDQGSFTFSLWYRGHRLHLVIRGRTAEVTADPTGAPAIEIECRGRVQHLASGQTIHVG